MVAVNKSVLVSIDRSINRISRSATALKTSHAVWSQNQKSVHKNTHFQVMKNHWKKKGKQIPTFTTRKMADQTKANLIFCEVQTKPFRNMGSFLFAPHFKGPISRTWFFVISWFDLIGCISVPKRIWEIVWGTFLVTKWYRFRISEPFSNRSKFEIFCTVHSLTYF